MSGPPTTAAAPSAEFAPLRSSPSSYSTASTPTSSTSTATACSSARPRQPSTSSPPWSSVTRCEAIRSYESKMKRWCMFRLGSLNVTAESRQSCVTRLTCWELPGRQRSTCKVTLAASGFTVSSSVSDCWNLAGPRGTSASISARVVT